MNTDPYLDLYREMLIEAAGHGALRSVQLLLSRSPGLAADIAAGNDCALGMAASNGHIEIVKFLHERGARIAGEGFARIGFCLAAENGHTETVRYMLERGVDYAGGECGTCQALNRAFDRGHHEIVRMLLDSGSRLRCLVPRLPPYLRSGEPGVPAYYSPEMQRVITDFNLWFPERRGTLSVLMRGIANWRRPDPPVLCSPPRTPAENLIRYLTHP